MVVGGKKSGEVLMMTFLLWCLLLVLCWPLALAVLILYPLVWLLLLPFRLIGLTFKIRSKTMRGFKSDEKVLSHPILSSFLRGQDGVCDLREVI